MKKIKIGTGADKMAMKQAATCQSLLAEHGVATEMVFFEKTGEQGILPKMEAALQTGELDATIEQLSDLLTSQPDGLVIASVSQRWDPAVWLIFPLAHIADNQLFKLKNGASLGVSSDLQKAQLLHFRPDVFFEKMENDLDKELEKLRSGNMDALVANADNFQLQTLNIEEFHIVKFNPIEFVPAPGQGVFAFRCCENDHETRRLLRLLHHPAVSAVTNIERSVLKIWGGRPDLPLGVYCEKDGFGNFHAYAVLADAWDQPLRRVRISQNTHLSLAENLVKSLHEKG